MNVLILNPLTLDFGNSKKDRIIAKAILKIGNLEGEVALIKEPNKAVQVETRTFRMFQEAGVNFTADLLPTFQDIYTNYEVREKEARIAKIEQQYNDFWANSFDWDSKLPKQITVKLQTLEDYKDRILNKGGFTTTDQTTLF